MASRTSLYFKKGPGGKIAIEDMGRSTGARFFVHATIGTDGTAYGATPEKPFASLDYAIGNCTASKGDIIYLMPGHAETTTAIAADVIGIQIIGLGTGRLKPALTATAAATDLLNISAANIHVENIRFVGAASLCTALIDIAAADAEIVKCVFEQAATPVSAITVTAAGLRFSVQGCYFTQSANGPDYGIEIEGHVTGWRVENTCFNYSLGGLDNAAIAVSSADCAPNGFIKDIQCIGMDALAIDFNSSDTAAADGLITGLRVTTTLANSIDNVIDLGGYCLLDGLVTNAAAKGGTKIPTTTTAG